MLNQLVFLCFLLLKFVEAGRLSFNLKAKPAIQDVLDSNKLEPQMDVFGSNVQSALYNMRYYGEVSVGRPPKVFTVIFDTGSPALWLPKINCKTDSPSNRALCNASQSSLYDPGYSKTSHKLSGKFAVNYGINGDESSTHGDFYSDYFMFGNFNNPKKTLKLSGPIVFGAADFVNRLEKGIFGLGIPVANSPSTSIFDAAYKQGVLDKPIFSLFFKKCPTGQEECNDGGVITLGDQDTRNCESNVIGWASVYSYGGPWQYNVQGLKVGNYSYNQVAIATSDSGSPLLHMPHKVVDGIGRELGAKKEGSYLVVKCSKKFELQLKINGQLYLLPKEQLTYEIGDGKCLLNIQGANSNLWLLGTPMIRSFCHIHDWSARKIGFARPKQQ